MTLRKQAKILNKQQVDAVLFYLSSTRRPIRNKVVLLLSLKAGLRAKEIAGLTWSMITTSEGKLADDISLYDDASKGRSGRKISLCRELKQALQLLFDEAHPSLDARVITTERSSMTTSQSIVNLFARWYFDLGFQGCSSHSGRRTFITNAARRISTVGGSLRDVQELAGHSSLTTTQRYIEVNAEAKRRVVELV